MHWLVKVALGLICVPLGCAILALMLVPIYGTVREARNGEWGLALFGLMITMLVWGVVLGLIGAVVSDAQEDS